MVLEQKELNIAKEHHVEEIPSNCFFTPRTWRDVACYYAVILFLTAFLWFAGLYIWAIHDNDAELKVGRGLTITGIIIAGGAMLTVLGWCCMRCRDEMPEETKKGEEIEMA